MHFSHAHFLFHPFLYRERIAWTDICRLIRVCKPPMYRLRNLGLEKTRTGRHSLVVSLEVTKTLSVSSIRFLNLVFNGLFLLSGELYGFIFNKEIRKLIIEE